VTNTHQNFCRYRVEYTGQAFYYDELREALSEFSGGYWVVYNQRTGAIAAAGLEAMRHLGLDSDPSEA